MAVSPRTFGVPECDECPEITPALIGACASVGIEHGRTAGHELALYLAAQHAKHVPDLEGELK